MKPDIQVFHGIDRKKNVRCLPCDSVLGTYKTFYTHCAYRHHGEKMRVSLNRGQNTADTYIGGNGKKKPLDIDDDVESFDEPLVTIKKPESGKRALSLLEKAAAVEGDKSRLDVLAELSSGAASPVNVPKKSIPEAQARAQPQAQAQPRVAEKKDEQQQQLPAIDGFIAELNNVEDDDEEDSILQLMNKTLFQRRLVSRLADDFDGLANIDNDTLSVAQIDAKLKELRDISKRIMPTFEKYCTARVNLKRKLEDGDDMADKLVGRSYSTIGHLVVLKDKLEDQVEKRRLSEIFHFDLENIN
jgi:hypothetical protein